MSAPDLSVAMVTFRTPDDACDCLRSLFYNGGLRGLDAEVIVVDNASGDETPDRIAGAFPHVRLIRSDENLGFSKATNRATREARGRFVLWLNPDTLIPDGALAACVAFLESKGARAGAMTCAVRTPDGTMQWDCARRLITPWMRICRLLRLDALFPRSDWFNREPMVRWDRKGARIVPAATGAFLLIRRDALEKVGLLDERFFFMYEDVDWCKRLGDAGLELWFWPDVSITHRGGASWKQDPARNFAEGHIATMQYFEKHHPRAVGTVRAASALATEAALLTLRLRLFLRPEDRLARRRWEMARAARLALRR